MLLSADFSGLKMKDQKVVLTSRGIITFEERARDVGIDEKTIQECKSDIEKQIEMLRAR